MRTIFGLIRYSFCCIRLFFFKSDIKFVRKKGLGSPDFMAHWISFAERIGMPFVKTIKNYWVLFERYSLTRYRKTTKQPHVHILGLGWGPQLGILLENILILRILKIYLTFYQKCSLHFCQFNQILQPGYILHIWIFKSTIYFMYLLWLQKYK